MNESATHNLFSRCDSILVLLHRKSESMAIVGQWLSTGHTVGHLMF